MRTNKATSPNCAVQLMRTVVKGSTGPQRAGWVGTCVAVATSKSSSSNTMVGWLAEKTCCILLHSTWFGRRGVKWSASSTSQAAIRGFVMRMGLLKATGRILLPARNRPYLCGGGNTNVVKSYVLHRARSTSESPGPAHRQEQVPGGSRAQAVTGTSAAGQGTAGL